MPAERASVFETSSIGLELEGSPGTEARYYKRLKGTSFESNIMATFNKFRAKGFKYGTKNVLGKEWSEATIDGIGCFDDSAYLLSGLYGNATISEITPGAQRWRWTPDSDGPDTGRTFSVISGTAAVRAQRFTNGLITGLEQTFSRDAIEVNGLMMGKLMDEGITIPASNRAETQTITITGSPTGGDFTLTVSLDGVSNTTAAIAYDATSAAVVTALEATAIVAGSGADISATGGSLPGTPVVVTFKMTGAFKGNVPLMTANGAGLTGGTAPAVTVTQTQSGFYVSRNALTDIQPNMVNVYLDTLFGDIGETQLTRDIEAAWSITGKYGPIWALDRSQSSWSAPVELAPDNSIKLRLAADSAGMAMLDHMREGQRTYIRIEAIGDEIGSTGEFYSLIHDFSCEVGDIGKQEDTDGLNTIEWTFDLIDDDDMGGAQQHELITDMATL